MIDYKPTLVAKLQQVGLPVYYELFADSSSETPCITYIESNNAALQEGNELRYSRIAYQIKIWGNDLQTLSEYAVSLDYKMREIGFSRISMNELSVNTQIQLIFRYEATAYEN